MSRYLWQLFWCFQHKLKMSKTGRKVWPGLSSLEHVPRAEEDRIQVGKGIHRQRLGRHRETPLLLLAVLLVS